MLPREVYAKWLNDSDCFEAAENSGLGSVNIRAIKPSKYYVYALAYPDTGKVFYIGKGVKDRWRFHEMRSRIFQHENARVQDAINRIEADGKLCIAICVKDGLSEDEAYNLERYLIEAVDGTFNGAKGRMTEAEKNFSLYRVFPRVTRLHLYMPDGRKTWLHDHVKAVMRVKREGLVEWGRKAKAERAAA